MTRIRYKTNTTTDDFASSLDPNQLRFVVGGTTAAGSYLCTLVPEDDSIDPLEIEFVRTTENDTAIAAGMAARAVVLAASAPGWSFLKPSSSSSSTTCSLAIHPNAPILRPEYSAPAGATLTPDVEGAYPLVVRSDGKGALSITVIACDGDVPQAPGSGTVDLELVEVIDRTQPRGRKGHEVPDALAATTVADSVDDQALNDPWVVSAPAGLYWVRISGDTSLPAGTDSLEVWVDEVEAPAPLPVTNVQVGTTIETYELDVDFSDLGSGASDAIALADFPVNVFVLGAGFEPSTTFAGEADLAFTIGDTAAANGLVASTALDSATAGVMLSTPGAQTGFHFEADWAGDGAAITFTATELDDVTAGAGTVKVYYVEP